MNIHTLTHYATRDGIPPRKAQRHNKKHQIGSYDPEIANGIWFLTENDWDRLKKLIPDVKKGGKDEK